MAYAFGALGGTRTPTILLTATSRQRVYQFRHERKKKGTMSAPEARRRRRCNKSAMAVQGHPHRDSTICRAATLACTNRFRQHLLDFDRDPVAIDEHDPGGHRQSVGEDLDFVRLGSIEFDDGTPAKTHDLMNRHGRGSQNHHKIDADFIEGWHRTDYRTDKRKIAYPKITTLWLADG